MQIPKPFLALFKILYIVYIKLIEIFLKPILSFESKSFENIMINERPIEYSFLFEYLMKIYPKKILDVGSGESAMPHVLANCGFDVTATDKKGNYWQSIYFNRHYPILNDDIINSKINEKFDLISCISVLEHIPNSDKAIKGMFNLLEKEGLLLISFPYNKDNYINNVYELEEAGYGKNSPYICQVFSDKEINEWIKDNNAKVVDQRFYEVFTGDYWTFGKRFYPPREVSKNDKHHLTCLCIKKM